MEGRYSELQPTAALLTFFPFTLALYQPLLTGEEGQRRSADGEGKCIWWCKQSSRYIYDQQIGASCFVTLCASVMGSKERAAVAKMGRK